MQRPQHSRSMTQPAAALLALVRIARPRAALTGLLSVLLAGGAALQVSSAEATTTERAAVRTAGATAERDGVDQALPASTRVATFNVLGASHTAPGGNSSNHIPGPTRMRWTVKKLTEHRISIVGMQEFEPVQEAAFTRLTAGAWNYFPKSGGQAGSANVVAWRSDSWA